MVPTDTRTDPTLSKPNGRRELASQAAPNPSKRDVIAFSIMCLGMYLGLTNIQIVNSSFKEIQGELASQCCRPSVVTLALGSVHPDKAKNASALFNLVMRLGAAVAIAIGSNELENRTLRHYSEIADTVSFDQPSVGESMPRLSELFEGRLGNSPTSGRAGINLLVDNATRQAMIMAFNDVPRIAALLAAIALVLLPLFRSCQRPDQSATTLN